VVPVVQAHADAALSYFTLPRPTVPDPCPWQREGAFVSLIQSKMEAEKWLANRLVQEGPGLWTDRESEELAAKLAQDYRPQGAAWRVKEWRQQPEGIPVHVVTRGGDFGIHTVNEPGKGRERSRQKADAIMRALNALDAEMRETSGKP
jgi:hypothetical protein